MCALFYCLVCVMGRGGQAEEDKWMEGGRTLLSGNGNGNTPAVANAHGVYVITLRIAPRDKAAFFVSDHFTMTEARILTIHILFGFTFTGYHDSVRHLYIFFFISFFARNILVA